MHRVSTVGVAITKLVAARALENVKAGAARTSAKHPHRCEERGATHRRAVNAVMKVLLLGGTGGCGRHALLRLLERGVEVTAIVRSESRLPPAAVGHARLTVVAAPEGHLAMDAQTMLGHIRGCDAVISCLGHDLSFRGIWGEPKQLCIDTTRRVCEALAELQAPAPVKFIVVSTEGVDRPDGSDPPRGRVERLLLWLLWAVLPPHADNMATLTYLVITY